jgi:hypothetical protein
VLVADPYRRSPVVTVDRPVPPYCEPIAVPFQVPTLIVPDDTDRPLTAVELKVPPEIVPPDIVAPLIVEAEVTTPAALTLNLLVGVEPDCRSMRFPLGDALVLLANM